MARFPSSWREKVLARGWGTAVLDVGSVQPDNGEGLTRGIIGLVSGGKPRGLRDWGALRAWAWGASRVMDYFGSDKAIAADRVGIMGHSRFGKAALVAMAFDPRFAVAFISSSAPAAPDCCAAITASGSRTSRRQTNIIGSMANS